MYKLTNLLPPLSLYLFLFSSILSLGVNAVELERPFAVVKGHNAVFKINGDRSKDLSVLIDGKEINVEKIEDQLVFEYRFLKPSNIVIKHSNNVIITEAVKPFPAWLSLIPPLTAIILALIFREVIVSLFFGIYVGALICLFYSNGFESIVTALFPVIDRYILNSLNDSGHLSVIIFSMLIGATVSVISKNGGMNGVVNYLSKYAKNRRSGQMITWLLGILIFFDDYANTLIVGNTMRPVTDKLKISREKLSYIVDSTAAPIAAIAFVTTWIGAELGYIEEGIAHISAINTSAYNIFIQSIQYSFYPILTLLFIPMIIWMGREYGPMFKAEKTLSSHSNQQFVNDEMSDFKSKDPGSEKSFNAIIPVLTIIIGTMVSLAYTGWETEVWSDESVSFVQKLSSTIGNSDAYKALLWSSLLGLVIASILSITQKILSVKETMESIMGGFKTMLTAMIILILAWSLSAVTDDMQTAGFLSNSLSSGLSPYWLPVITFVLSALVSFSTGSSWGSMAILYPLVLSLSWSVFTVSSFDTATAMPLFLNVVSAVLAGSVLGDHCSPISDTTILSSLASSCNHIDHVRTQLPYALTVGIVSIVFGTIPASYGIPTGICYALSLSTLFLIIKKFGKRV